MTQTTSTSAFSAYDLAPEQDWRTSSYSSDGSGNCISIAERTAGIGVRDSKIPTGPAFLVGRAAFTAFVDHVKSI